MKKSMKNITTEYINPPSDGFMITMVWLGLVVMFVEKMGVVKYAVKAFTLTLSGVYFVSAVFVALVITIALLPFAALGLLAEAGEEALK